MALRIDIAAGRVETGGTGALLGVLGFVLASGGIVLAWMLFDGGHGIQAGSRPAGPQDAWLPALLVLGGLVISGYRSRTTIDVGTRTRTHWRRFWWNERTVVEPLGEPQHIRLETQRRGSGKNSRIVHPLTLVTSDGAHELGAPGNERAARSTAESLARLFAVDLHDQRGGTPLVRKPEALDRSVVELAAAEETEDVAPPHNRVRVRETGSRTELLVRSPYRWLLLAAFVPALVPAGLVLTLWLPRIFDDGGPREPLGWALFVAVPVLMTLVPLGVLAAGGGGGLFTRRLVIERGELRAGRSTLPWNEIEELHVTEGRALARSLRVASDRTTFHLGRGLSVPELRHLRAVILRALRERR